MNLQPGEKVTKAVSGNSRDRRKQLRRWQQIGYAVMPFYGSSSIFVVYRQ